VRGERYRRWQQIIAEYYNWVKCMSFDGERLWCGVHSMRGLISYEPRVGILIKYEKFDGQDLPEACSISTKAGLLVLNDSLKIPASGLSRSPSTPL